MSNGFQTFNQGAQNIPQEKNEQKEGSSSFINHQQPSASQHQISFHTQDHGEQNNLQQRSQTQSQSIQGSSHSPQMGQGSLNFYQRKKELQKINKENLILLKTIQGAQATYTRVDWRQHFQKFKQYRKQIGTTRYSQTLTSSLVNDGSSQEQRSKLNYGNRPSVAQDGTTKSYTSPSDVGMNLHQYFQNGSVSSNRGLSSVFGDSSYLPPSTSHQRQRFRLQKQRTGPEESKRVSPTRYQNPQTPTNQEVKEFEVEDEDEKASEINQHYNVKRTVVQRQQQINQIKQQTPSNAMSNQFFHRRVQTTEPNQRGIESILNKAKISNTKNAKLTSIISQQKKVPKRDQTIQPVRTKLRDAQETRGQDQDKFELEGYWRGSESPTGRAADLFPQDTATAGTIQTFSNFDIKQQHRSKSQTPNNISNSIIGVGRSINQVQSSVGPHHDQILNKLPQSQATAYAEVLKIYYPKGNFPKFKIKSTQQPVHQLINNIINGKRSVNSSSVSGMGANFQQNNKKVRNSNLQSQSQQAMMQPVKVNQWMRNLNQVDKDQPIQMDQNNQDQSEGALEVITQNETGRRIQNLDFEFSPPPFNKINGGKKQQDSYQLEAIVPPLEFSEQKRNELMSRQGRRQHNNNLRGTGETKVLRNRAQVAVTGSATRPGIFDDRFELESRGKANATGLSGTSDPEENERDEDEISGVIAGEGGAGEFQGVEDSAYHQTNYYNYNNGMPILHQYDPTDDHSQILHTQQFDDSMVHPGQDGQGGSLKMYRDSLNMSQPVPRLDNSSMMHNSIHRDVDIFNNRQVQQAETDDKEDQESPERQMEPDFNSIKQLEKINKSIQSSEKQQNQARFGSQRLPTDNAVERTEDENSYKLIEEPFIPQNLLTSMNNERSPLDKDIAIVAPEEKIKAHTPSQNLRQSKKQQQNHQSRMHPQSSSKIHQKMNEDTFSKSNNTGAHNNFLFRENGQESERNSQDFGNEEGDNEQIQIEESQNFESRGELILQQHQDARLLIKSQEVNQGIAKPKQKLTFQNQNTFQVANGKERNNHLPLQQDSFQMQLESSIPNQDYTFTNKDANQTGQINEDEEGSFGFTAAAQNNEGFKLSEQSSIKEEAEDVFTQKNNRDSLVNFANKVKIIQQTNEAMSQGRANRRGEDKISDNKLKIQNRQKTGPYVLKMKNPTLGKQETEDEEDQINDDCQDEQDDDQAIEEEDYFSQTPLKNQNNERVQPKEKKSFIVQQDSVVRRPTPPSMKKPTLSLVNEQERNSAEDAASNNNTHQFLESDIEANSNEYEQINDEEIQDLCD